MPAPARAPRRFRSGSRPRVWRGAVLALAGAYFLLPLLASFVFTVHVPGQGVSFEAYTQLLGAEGFTRSLLLSLGLAAATITASLLLAVPALVAVRIGSPRLRPVVEVMCMMPLVVPPIALVTGITTVLRWGPEHLSRTPLYQTFLAVQNPDFPSSSSSRTRCSHCPSSTAPSTRACGPSTYRPWSRRPAAVARAGPTWSCA